jgi:hypothetical protein
MLSAKQ